MLGLSSNLEISQEMLYLFPADGLDIAVPPTINCSLDVFQDAFFVEPLEAGNRHSGTP